MTDQNRRKFLLNTAAIAAGGMLISSPFTACASPQKNWTVGEIMDLFLKEIQGAPFYPSVIPSKARDLTIDLSLLAIHK